MNIARNPTSRRIAASIAIAIAASGAWAAADETLFDVEAIFVKAGREALAASGYFDANPVDATTLQKRLLSRDDVEKIGPSRFLTRPDETRKEMRSMRCVTEYIFPTNYLLKAASESEPAAIEADKFTMREVGTAFEAKVSPTDSDDLVDLDLWAELAGEPTWANFGASSKEGDAVKYDLPAEQPTFPVVKFSAERLRARLGQTFMLAGLPESGEGSAKEFVLVFAKVSRYRVDGGAAGAPVAALQGASTPGSNVELDIRVFSAAKKTLASIGYFDTNKVDAALLQERLMAASGARLNASPRITARSGAGVSLAVIAEYGYPTEYQALTADLKTVTCEVNAKGVVAVPRSITRDERGAYLRIKPVLADGRVNIEFNAQLKGFAAQGGKPSRDQGINDTITVKIGETAVFGKGACRGNGEILPLIFVTPRLVEP